MVIKVLISGISASKEIKKHQQRAQMLLDSLKIRYETIDISEPGHEEEKELMKNVCKKRNNNPTAHPPQFFNEEQYCGDYEDLSLASDEDTVLSFLGLEEDMTIENGDVSSSEGITEQIDINSVVNGVKSPQNTDEVVADEEDNDEEVTETTVQERLTLNGQVIDIPADKIFELKGHKIDLKELMSKTERIPVEDSHTDVAKPSDDNEDNQMSEEEEDAEEEQIKPKAGAAQGSDEDNEEDIEEE